MLKCKFYIGFVLLILYYKKDSQENKSLFKIRFETIKQIHKTIEKDLMKKIVICKQERHINFEFEIYS